MCTGMEIASIAASVGGAMIQQNAVKKAQRKQEEIANAAAAQRDALQRQAEATAQESADHFSQPAQEEAVAQDTTRYADHYKQSVDDVASQTQLPGAGTLDDPTIVAEMERATADAKDRGYARADSAAVLSALGSAFMGANEQLARNSGKINTLSTHLRGVADAANTDMARVKPNSNTMLLGQLLSGAGQVGLTSSLMAPTTGTTATISAAPATPGVSTLGAPIPGISTFG